MDNYKLTEADKIDIQNDPRTQEVIAKDYCVSQGLVSRIKRTVGAGRITDEAFQRIFKKYMNGESIKDLHSKYNMTYRALVCRIHRHKKKLEAEGVKKEFDVITLPLSLVIKDCPYVITINGEVWNGFQRIKAPKNTLKWKRQYYSVTKLMVDLFIDEPYSSIVNMTGKGANLWDIRLRDNDFPAKRSTSNRANLKLAVEEFFTRGLTAHQLCYRHNIAMKDFLDLIDLHIRNYFDSPMYTHDEVDKVLLRSIIASIDLQQIPKDFMNPHGVSWDLYRTVKNNISHFRRVVL